MQQSNSTQPNTAPGFEDHKYCPSCEAYNRYLLSVTKSFCIECGGEMSLFSQGDRQSFALSLEARRPKKKGGRPRKQVARSA